MKPLRLLMLVSLTAVLFAACSKDTTEPTNPTPTPSTPTKTPKELLIGTWIIVSQVYTLGGEKPLEDCVKDNLMAIQSGGKYIIDQGAIKCDPTTGQTTDGNWTMDNYPAIYFKLNDPSTEGTNAKITQLDETTLKMLEYEGEPSEVTITFKRK
jgi:hypothetical protein